jgi:hypothetical protein
MVQGSSWVGALILALFSQGCSFLFVDGPPDRHEKLAYFDCTSSAGPEVVDITYALIAGAVAAGTTTSDDEDGSARGANLLVAGVFGASAVYGIVKTTECNNAKDALRIRLMKVFEREARLRAMERQRQAPPPDLLTHPPRLPKRKKQRPVRPVPVVLEEDPPVAPPVPPGSTPPVPPGSTPPVPPGSTPPVPPGSTPPVPPGSTPSSAPPAPPAPAPAPGPDR